MAEPHTESRINKTLYDISSEIIELDNLLEECGGDVTNPEVEARVNELFDSTSKDFPAKVDSYCALIAEHTTRSLMLMAEAERIAGRAESHEKTAKGLQERLLFNLQRLDINRMETTRFKVSVARSGGKIPVKINSDVSPGDLPAELKERFVKVTQKEDWDKDALREALEKGETFSFAELKERGFNLRIR